MVLYYQPERNLSTIFSYLFEFFHVFATFFTVLSCKLRYKSNKYLLFDFCIHISFLCIYCVFTANICRNCIYFANTTESTERYTCACDDIVVLYACTHIRVSRTLRTFLKTVLRKNAVRISESYAVVSEFNRRKRAINTLFKLNRRKNVDF